MPYPRILSLAALFTLLAGAALLVWLRPSPTVDAEPDQWATSPTRPPTRPPPSPPADQNNLPQGADPTSVAVHSAGGRVYWTEYAAGRIRVANLDGSGGEVVVADIDGPVGLVVSEGDKLLFWTTDGAYPRKVQRARLDGTDVRDVIGEKEVNRPSAIAIDAASREIYWSESVAGRIRRIGKGDVVEVVDSGVSSTGDVAGSEVTWALGIALDLKAGKLYWTELTSGTIQRSNLDGTAEEVIVRAGDPCAAPAGIALDQESRKLYWADIGCGTIFRANLDGTEAEAIVTQRDGLIGPRGIAVDEVGRTLYWTDVVTERIQRAELDGSRIEDVVRTEAADERAGEDDCAHAVRTSGRLYAARKVHAMTICLEKVGAVKAVKRGEADAAKVARSCVALLHDLAPEDGPLDSALRVALDAACPAGAPSRLPAAASVSCAQIAAAGSDSAGGWIKCVSSAYSDLAWNTVVSRVPRTLEWIEEVRPFVESLGTDSNDRARVAAALSVLDALYAAMSDRARVVVESSGGLPASGQTTSYPVSGQAVPDDGALQAGARMRFRDNLDGTISDLNTGLTWEKKCDCPDSLHDFRRRLPWSGSGREGTIWDWLEQVSSEGESGFAGHSDWRIPNAKELMSIIDYERFNPAVDIAFDGPFCGLGCSDLRDPRCSCTTMRAHWSSTSFADDPGNALAVGFHLGLLGDVAKREGGAVRAVRGGLLGSTAATR